MEEKLLTIAQAAGILDVSVDTLRRWDKNGKLVAMRKKWRHAPVLSPRRFRNFCQ